MVELQAYRHPMGGFIASFNNWSYGSFFPDTPTEQYGKFFQQLPRDEGVITVASTEPHPASSAGFKNLPEGDLRSFTGFLSAAAQASDKFQDLEFRVLGD